MDEIDGNIAALDKWMERNEYLDGVASAIINDSIPVFKELSKKLDDTVIEIENELMSLSHELEDKGVYIDTANLAEDISSTKGAEAVKFAMLYLSGDCDGD